MTTFTTHREPQIEMSHGFQVFQLKYRKRSIVSIFVIWGEHGIRGVIRRLR